MVQSKKSCVDITAFSEYRSILMVSAALSIFLMHIICSGIYTFGSALDKMIVLWGSSGVDIFFFLSGMGIYCSLDNSHKNCGGGHWYRNRLLKVMIPYILIIIPFSILNKDSFAISVSRISTLYFWIFQNDGCWFVSFIILMYLASPLMYRVIKTDEGRPSSRTVWVLLTCVCIALLVFEWAAEDLFLRLSIGISRIPSFIVGMMIGSNLKRRLTGIPLGLLPLLVIVSIVEFLLDVNEMSFIILTLKSCRSLLILSLEAMLITTVSAKVKGFFQGKAIASLGSITLEFYLIHLLILNLIRSYNITVLNDRILMVGLFLAATIIMSYGVHIISKRLLRFLQV